jgi:hypothetical protein
MRRPMLRSHRLQNMCHIVSSASAAKQERLSGRTDVHSGTETILVSSLSHQPQAKSCIQLCQIVLSVPRTKQSMRV